MSRSWQALDDELAQWHDSGRGARVWLRDDDAVEPTAALDRLLNLDLPLTIASIPVRATPALAAHLQDRTRCDVAVHGYAHINHASAGEKKQELGLYRGRTVILSEIAEGLKRLRDLFAAQCLSLLVPPWNNIDPALVPELPRLGFTGLSTYGGKKFSSGKELRVIDTHVDIIDWSGTRGGRPSSDVMQQIVALLCQRREAASNEPVGILSHHLVHDDMAWRILGELIDCVDRSSAAEWTASRHLLSA